MATPWDWRARLYDMCEGSDLRRGLHKARLFNQMSGSALFLALGTGVDIRHFPPARRIAAVDISAEMLRRAAPRARAYTDSLHLARADALSLCFRDASFDDVVTSCTVFGPRRARGAS